MEWVKLKECCEIIMGQSPESTSYNQEGKGLPFFQGNADFGDIYPSIRLYCDNPTKISEKNDILLSVRAPIGAVNIATEKCCIGRGLSAIRTIDNISNTKYFFYFLKSKEKWLNQQGTGSTFKAINKDVLQNLNIKLIPISGQICFAENLDKVKNIINARKKQIGKCDEYIKSVFYTMFGDPVMNPKRWEKEELKGNISIIGGYAFKSKEYTNSGIPIIRIGNVNSGLLNLDNIVYWKPGEEPLRRYELHPNDLVITLTGTVGKEDYGNVCVITNAFGKYYLNQRVAKLEIINQKLSPVYLRFVLKDKKLKSKLTIISRGIRQANISNEDIYNLQIPLPPLDLQRQFAAIVEKTEAHKELLKKSLAKMETLFDCLMDKYFN